MAAGLQRADAVEKRFFSSGCARWIQDQAPIRNVDSKILSPRFDNCVFLFYRFFAATFSTTSTRSGPHRDDQTRGDEGHRLAATLVTRLPRRHGSKKLKLKLNS